MIEVIKELDNPIFPGVEQSIASRIGSRKHEPNCLNDLVHEFVSSGLHFDVDLLLGDSKGKIFTTQRYEACLK
jgi:hypothetical protein